MSTTDLIYFRKLYNDSIVPVRATPCAAAFDLYAYEDTIITGGAGNIMVSTGVAVQLPRGTYGRIAMRSGLAAREHLSVSAGVIDRDYTGEIKVLVFCSKVLDTTPTNKGLLLPHTYTIRKNERFAQLIVEKISEAAGQQITTTRPIEQSIHDGFGSTGSY